MKTTGGLGKPEWSPCSSKISSKYSSIFQNPRGGWGKWGMFAVGAATSAVAVAAAKIGDSDFVAHAAKPIDLFDDDDTTDFKRLV